MLHDIAAHQDVEKLVDTFYSDVVNDALLAPFFSEIDFEHHKPRMVHFWSFVLLDEPGYNTNIFDKHVKMALTKEALHQWVCSPFYSSQHSVGNKQEDGIVHR